MTTVAVENDLVLLVMDSQRRDVLYPCAAAEKLVPALREAADLAEKNKPALFRGEPWEVQVISYDGYVALSFSQATSRVPMPARIARQLATEIEARIPEAKHKLRLAWHFKGFSNGKRRLQPGRA